MLQKNPFCRCGAAAIAKNLCRCCYRRRWHSRKMFGGNREEVLRRDGACCRGCRNNIPVVHHRQPGDNEPDKLVTLCAACHAIVERTMTLRRWVPLILELLWEEKHPGRPKQLRLLG